ncbi:TonB-dependent receptor [Chitinophaga lutea]
MLSGHVWDVENARAADTVLVIARKDSAVYRAFSTGGGRFSFGPLLPGTYQVSISSLLYQTAPVTLHLHKDHELALAVKPVRRTLPEVFITASEAKKAMTSTSVIDQKAMQHLQPSSFADLMELLPGGRAKDPSLTTMNQIRLREAYEPTSNYDISSLGTAFIIDGAPVNTSANLQSSARFFATDPNEARNTVNKGVDMRTISTDQIEKIEVVRGIPSVEYGDLTSGVVNIERKKGYMPYAARFKADGFSKLFSLGKGWELPAQGLKLNADLGYLNAKADPRDNFQNYQRINASVRAEKSWQNAAGRYTWNGALDYSTNFDNKRTDPDNGYAPVDRYKSTFNAYTVQTGLRRESARKGALMQSWDLSARLNYQRDKIDAVKWVQARTATVLTNSMTAGDHDVTYLTPGYVSELVVDGQPLNAYFKAATQLGFKTSALDHQVRLGLETNYSKNFGKGQVYDMMFPTNPNAPNARPRAFDTIPGMLNQAFFAEDKIAVKLGGHTVTTALGVRGMALLGMDSRYTIANKPYVDPRINTRWELPGIAAGRHILHATFGAGYGLHTKMPTLAQLYPDAQYTDIVQLNFYHNNPAFRKANAVTYISDRRNFDLKPAVNRKFEINGDFELNGNRLSLTWFDERLTTGFRSASTYERFAYKKYDNASVDPGNLTEAPATSDFTYTEGAQYYGFSTTINGSSMFKQGLEFSFTSKRVKALNTRFSMNGAYFRTTYRNTYPLYDVSDINAVYNGDIRQLIALYTESDGEVREQLNTNVTVDTYLPKLGLTLSTSLQNVWFTAGQEDWRSGMPEKYWDIDGNEYAYTEASKNAPVLNTFYKNYSAAFFYRRVIPIDLQVNLKATKEFKYAAIAMFVNRLFTYTPDYMFNGTKVVRNPFNSPYFGMEMNIKF